MKNIYKNSRGMSLVEMLVVIGIFSLCMIGMSIFFAKIWSANAYIYETGQDSIIASRSVNLIAGDLRKARQADNGDYAVDSASDFDLKVFIDIDDDGDTERVHYFLDQNADQMKRGITEPSESNPPAYPASDDSVKALASHVVNDSGTPVFAYFGRNYLIDQTPFEAPVDSGDIIDIRLIKVKLLVDIRPYHSPDHVTIESFAQMRNLKDHEQSE